jgi:hypothetical protein
MRGIENFLVGTANGLAYFGQDRLSDENLVQLVQHNFISSFYFNRSENILPQVKYYSPALPCPALPCPALPCPALPCPALPCPALPCPALPCPPQPTMG